MRGLFAGEEGRRRTLLSLQCYFSHCGFQWTRVDLLSGGVSNGQGLIRSAVGFHGQELIC